MLVTNRKMFNVGGLLALSFIGVLILIFSPVFQGMNGLEYSDDLFNKLSKGSSYFIPKVKENAQKYVGTNLTMSVKMDKPEAAKQAEGVLSVAGAQAEAAGADVKLNGDLGKLLSAALADSDAMYKNDGSKVSTLYGFDAREVMTTWWNLLSKVDKELKKEKKVEQSNMVSEVMKKGIEPAFNFYGIEAQKVTDKAFTMIGLLVFYVAYTMWWGYAIFYLFDGLGLSMKKAKVKKEV